jgi:tRNA1(Val) A37 N6-methylase TrmN6
MPRSKDSSEADAFLGGRVALLQPAIGPRAGLDAVFLAATCPADATVVLDAGAGAGTVSMCAAWRAREATFTGVEINPALAALYRQNAAANGFLDRMSVIEADLTAPFSLLERLGVRANGYDQILCNPPFFKAGRVRAPRDDGASLAHVAAPEGLEPWFRFFAAVAAPKGMLTLIHLASALPDIIRAAESRFGGLRVFPLFPREGEAAIRVIVRGEKGSRAPMTLLRGMLLHDTDGFTPQARAILRDGAPIEL